MIPASKEKSPGLVFCLLTNMCMWLSHNVPECAHGKGCCTLPPVAAAGAAVLWLVLSPALTEKTHSIHQLVFILGDPLKNFAETFDLSVFLGG